MRGARHPARGAERSRDRASAFPHIAYRRRWTSCINATAASSSRSAASSRTSTARWRTARRCGHGSECSSGSRTRTACASRRIEASSRPRRSSSPPAPGRRTSRGYRPGSSGVSASPSPGSSRRGRSSSSPTGCPSSISRSTASTSTGSRRTASPASSWAATTTSESGGDPDTISREPTLEDEAPLRAFAERYFPDGAGPTVALKTCLFEPSPDEHFLIDRHPDAPSAVVAAGFSGHGYKFCSVVGEILADLAIDGSTRARHRAVPARPLLSDLSFTRTRAWRNWQTRRV